jgi:hypothetical protein
MPTIVIEGLECTLPQIGWLVNKYRQRMFDLRGIFYTFP